MENLSLGGPDAQNGFFLDELVVSKACRILNRNIFTVTFNQILEVISNTRTSSRMDKMDMDYK
jgi:hypothetical protein